MADVEESEVEEANGFFGGKNCGFVDDLGNPEKLVVWLDVVWNKLLPRA